MTIYGTPVLRAGDTVYGVGTNLGGHLGLLLADLTAGNLDGPVTFTLFDSGGIDTLNFSTDTDDQHVVLQPETASDVYGLIGNLAGLPVTPLSKTTLPALAMTSSSVTTPTTSWKAAPAPTPSTDRPVLTMPAMQALTLQSPSI